MGWREAVGVVIHGPPDLTSLTDLRTNMPVSPIVRTHLQHYPFNTANAPPGYTDDEYREVFGEEAYKHLVMGRISQRRKWGQKLPANEVEFLKCYPELDIDA